MKNYCRLIVSVLFAYLSVSGARAQLNAGTGGLYIKAGTTLSTDGLVLIPSADLTLTGLGIERSATAVTGTGPGINRAYTFSTPATFSGTLGLFYLAGELNGNTESLLQLAYKSTAAGTVYTPATGSSLNTASKFVENTFTGTAFSTVSAADPAIFVVRSANADLSALALSSGTLSPAFAPGTLDYTASVGNSISSLTVAPARDDAHAAITVNGTTVAEGNAPGSIALSVGSNTISTVVTAEDGSTSKTYTITVTRAAAQTITFDALLAKIYGDPGFTLTATASSGLDVSYVSDNPSVAVVTGNTVTVKATGTAKITASQAGNLSYDAAGAVEQSLVVSAKDITVTAAAKAKTYGDADPALTYTFAPALAAGDAFTGSLSRAAGESVGSYAISQGTLTLSSNYAISYSGESLAIGAKAIAVTAAAKSKTYGDADPSLTYSITSGSLTGSDAFTGSLSRAAGESVGSYAISQGTLTLSSNYAISYSGESLAIGAKAIAVTAAAKSKTYGDADPSLTYSITSGSLTGSDAFTGSLSRAAGESVGSYAISQGTLTLSSNYALSYAAASLAIGTKAITVIAAAKSKAYGDADPSLTYSITSGSLTGSDAFSGSLARAAGESVGSYMISQGTLALSNNYSLSYSGASLAIGAKAITVTAAAKSKTYGDADPSLTYSIISGSLTGSDAFSGSLARAAGESVGSYAINQGTLALSNNYAISYSGESLAIGAKAITVTAAAKSKTYGDADPALTYTFAPALAAGDAFSGSLSRAAGESVGSYAVSQGTLALSNNYALSYSGASLSVGAKAITVTAAAKSKAYGGADPALTYTFAPALATGDAFSGSLSRAAGESVGSYAISQGTLALSSNYALTYSGASLAIGAKAITVTAAAKSKTYGDADPSLTYSITSGSLTGSDAFSGSLARSAGESVGSYAISQGTLALSDNYALSYSGASLSVGAKAITVTAAAKSKTYGDADPALTYTFAPALAAGDAFTGSLARALGGNAGAYAINKNTLALSSNYSLTFVAGIFTISKAPLIITADNKSRLQNSNNPAFTFSYSGFVNGDNSNALSSQPIAATTALFSSPQGNYPITGGSAAAADYSISYVNGTLSITPGAPTSVSLAASTLFENRPAGTLAGTLSSTSADPNTVFTYSLASGAGSTDNALFSITGNALSTAASLDFELRPSYSILIRSTTLSGLWLDQQFSIRISDVNEAPTLNAIASQALCYTAVPQQVALSGITPGPETAQATTLSISTDKPGMFSQLATSGSSLDYVLSNAAAGTATVTVTVTDNGGIANSGINSFSQTFTITANALPVVLISSDAGTDISKGATATLTASGGTSYSWATAQGIVSGQSTAVLTVRPTVTTTYTVTASSASGCTETRSITLNVLEDFKALDASNVMSPNGDGVNDSWTIKNIDMYPNNEVKVFDRGGRLVFSKKGYANTWDATINGSPLAEGTYYYIVDFGAGNATFKGFITIVRNNK